MSHQKKYALTIYSQNLWGLPFRPKSTRKRFARFFAGLDDLGAEIYTLQETFDTKITHDEILMAWENEKRYFSRHDEVSYRRFQFLGSGLTTLSHLPIVRRHFFSFSHGSFFDRLSNKGVLLTTIQLDDIEIDIYNTHLQATYYWLGKFNNTRQKQIRELMTVITQESGFERPIFLAGDLNLEEKSVGYHDLVCEDQIQSNEIRFFDVKRKIHPNPQTHPFKTKKHRNPRLERRLDYILFRPAKGHSWLTQESTAEVHDLEVSDHRGVMAKIVFT